MNEYIVVTGSGDGYYQAIQDLEHEVNKKIEHGYTPIGGACFAEIIKGIVYATQAMIQEEHK